MSLKNLFLGFFSCLLLLFLGARFSGLPPVLRQQKQHQVTSIPTNLVTSAHDEVRKPLPFDKPYTKAMPTSLGDARKESTPASPTSVRDVAFYRRGTCVMTANPSHNVELWNAKTGKVLTVLSGDDYDIILTHAAITPSGDRVFLGGLRPPLIVWDAVRKQPFQDWAKKENFESTYSIAISPDGSRLLWGTYQQAQIRAVSTGKLLHTLHTVTEKNAPIDAVKFSPDGRFALTSAGGRVVLFDVASGKRLRQFAHSKQKRGVAVMDVNFASDSSLILIVNENNELSLWKRATGKLLRTFRIGPSDRGGKFVKSRGASFILNNTQIITGGERLNVWNAVTGKLIRRFPATKPKYLFTKIDVSPDNQFVLSLGENVALWEISTGNLVHIFE